MATSLLSCTHSLSSDGPSEPIYVPISCDSDSFPTVLDYLSESQLITSKKSFQELCDIIIFVGENKHMCIQRPIIPSTCGRTRILNSNTAPYKRVDSSSNGSMACFPVWHCVTHRAWSQSPRSYGHHSI